MSPWHHKHSVPLALLEFSATGTITKFTAQSSSSRVCPGITSLDRLPVHLRIFVELPILLWGSSWSPCSPWEWSGLWLYWSKHPPLVTGQSPPALLVCDGVAHCPMLACQPHCKCHTFTGVLLLREIIFHMTFCIGCWPAAMCLLMFSPQLSMASNVTKQLSVTPMSLGSCPPAMSTTLGAKVGLSWVYHPIWGLACALGPWQWTNNSTDLLGIK